MSDFKSKLVLNVEYNIVHLIRVAHLRKRSNCTVYIISHLTSQLNVAFYEASTTEVNKYIRVVIVLSPLPYILLDRF